jgi:hypothetical protein
VIRIEGRAVTFGEVWFDEEAAPRAAVDVLIHRQRPAAIQNRACSPFLTLVNDVTLPEEKLLAGFGRTLRYHINRAQRDEVRASVVAPASESLTAFSDFYDAFAKQKSLPPTYRRGLWAAAEAGQLVLTTASRAGEVLIWHAYIACQKRASLLYTASHFRRMEDAERALVSRANRWLHWQDMLTFKQQGFECYDWGGLFEDESSPERAGINRFKCDFGGRREMTWNCTFSVTAKGRLYLMVTHLLGKFGL